MILLIGFPKCGTMSFQKMFEKCKCKSLHWKKEMIILEIL